MMHPSRFRMMSGLIVEENCLCPMNRITRSTYLYIDMLIARLEKSGNKLWGKAALWRYLGMLIHSDGLVWPSARQEPQRQLVVCRNSQHRLQDILQNTMSRS